MSGVQRDEKESEAMIGFIIHGIRHRFGICGDWCAFCLMEEEYRVGGHRVNLCDSNDSSGSDDPSDLRDSQGR